jgi:hypothetical protein
MQGGTIDDFTNGLHRVRTNKKEHTDTVTYFEYFLAFL